MNIVTRLLAVSQGMTAFIIIGTAICAAGLATAVAFAVKSRLLKKGGKTHSSKDTDGQSENG